MGKVAARHDVSAVQSVDALLDVTGLNWEPEMVGATFTGSVIPSADWRAVVNPTTQTVLAYTGTRFRPNSHVKAIRDLEPLMQSGAISPHAVSIWDGGAKIAAQFRCHDLDVTIGRKSVVSPLLTLYINHDSESSDRSFFADFDFWCQNQAGMVSRIAGQGVRHGAGVIRRYADLVEGRILAMRQDEDGRYAAMRRMAESPVRLSGRALADYFARALDLPPDSVPQAWDEAAKLRQEGRPVELKGNGRVLQQVTEDWRADDHGVPGTVWHAYSAVTRYTTHTEGRNPATRAERALVGSQDRFVRAFQEAAKLVA